MPHSFRAMEGPVPTDWSFTGTGTKTGNKTYFEKLKIEYEDGKTREFKVGDSVYMGSRSEEWVGTIIALYNDPKKKDKMRVGFRWYYAHEDILERTIIKEGAEGHPYTDELYFSDHIDKSTNPVEVISGRAFLYQTLDEMRGHRIHPPIDSVEDDRVFLVKKFYSNTSKKTKLRLLNPHELAYLLKNPKDTVMYDAYRLMPIADKIEMREFTKTSAETRNRK